MVEISADRVEDGVERGEVREPGRCLTHRATLPHRARRTARGHVRARARAEPTDRVGGRGPKGTGE